MSKEVYIPGGKQNLMVQPMKSAKAISFSGGYSTIYNQSGNLALSTGVVSLSDGVLMVHLVDDYDENGKEVYIPLRLIADTPRGAVFNKVKEAGTTITSVDTLDQIIAHYRLLLHMLKIMQQSLA